MDFKERFFPPARSISREHELGTYTWFGYARLLKEMGTCSVNECGQGTAFVLVCRGAYAPVCVYHVCEFSGALAEHDEVCPRCTARHVKEDVSKGAA